jgi:hypothetical protein
MKAYTDHELIYSANAHCQSCRAGLAHPLDSAEALRMRAWFCSRVLRGEAEHPEQHPTYDFAFYKVKSEVQPSARGASTRPDGTSLVTLWQFHCRQCDFYWAKGPHRPDESIPAGPCPACGNTNGANLSSHHGPGEVPAIESRARWVVRPV